MPSQVKIRGNNQISWGAAGAGNIGKIQSGKALLTGEKVELVDENGETFCVIYFDDKDQCEFTAIFQTGVVLPARGDTIVIMDVPLCRVDDIERVRENKNARIFTIKGTRYYAME